MKEWSVSKFTSSSHLVRAGLGEAQLTCARVRVKGYRADVRRGCQTAIACLAPSPMSHKRLPDNSHAMVMFTQSLTTLHYPSRRNPRCCCRLPLWNLAGCVCVCVCGVGATNTVQGALLCEGSAHIYRLSTYFVFIH